MHISIFSGGSPADRQRCGCPGVQSTHQFRNTVGLPFSPVVFHIFKLWTLLAFMGPLSSLFTGGEPLFTHWVCAEYMVGSETKYPAWTHWVHFDYFCNLPPICPPKYPPATCWVFSKSTHHRTCWGWPWFTHWVCLDYFYISPTLCSPKYPLGTCWVFLQSTHSDTCQSLRWVHSKSTHQEPSG